MIGQNKVIELMMEYAKEKGLGDAIVIKVTGNEYALFLDGKENFRSPSAESIMAHVDFIAIARSF